MKMLKKWKRILMAVPLLVMIALITAVSVQHRRIQDYRKEIARQDALVEKLANMESVRCDVSITVKNTAVLGATKTGDLMIDAKQIATYLRGEVLQNIISKNDTIWNR